MTGWREALLAYLRDRLAAASAIDFARVGAVPAGASNETLAVDLRLECDGHSFELPLVLRPERQGGVLAPYDVGRQYGVMRALARTDVPVPTVAWLEPTGGVLGTPFFFMSRVAGETLPLFWYGSGPRLRAAAEALARVHAVDWRAAGLSFLLPGPGGEPLPSPVECELEQWRAKASLRGLASHPVLAALDAYLLRNEPRDARHALLHGDTNPGNYLFRGDRVAAVLDWEVAAIGDPRSDLGFYAALSALFGGGGGDDGRSLLSEAYEDVTGRAQRELAYYEALGLYKMAVVMAAWGGGGYALQAIASRVTRLVGAGWLAGG